MSSDVKDEVGEIFIAMEDLIEAEINHLNNSEIPPIILGSFNKLLRAINSSSKYYLTNFDDIQCTNFIFDEFSRIKIAREELLMFWLSLEGHIAKIKLDILEANFGSLAEAHSAISKGKYGQIKGIGEKQLEKLRFLSNMSEIEDKYANMVEKGIKYTHYFNKDYPDKLRNICSAPIGLFYKGNLPKNEEKRDKIYLHINGIVKI